MHIYIHTFVCVCECVCYQTPFLEEFLPQTCAQWLAASNLPKTDPVSVCIDCV